MGLAQTGTGKTAAFLVTILTRLLENPRTNEKLPSALVVAPTRELAYQIYDEAMDLGRHTGFSMVRVVGGVDYQKQAELLKKGPDIVICTPGRIIDYYKQKIFKTGNIKLLVIDEIGYLSYSNRHADLLFEIVSRRYEEKSTLITTNKPFAEWNQVFPNASCVVSLVDRLVHHSNVYMLGGESYRLKQKLAN